MGMNQKGSEISVVFALQNALSMGVDHFIGSQPKHYREDEASVQQQVQTSNKR